MYRRVKPLVLCCIMQVLCTLSNAEPVMQILSWEQAENTGVTLAHTVRDLGREWRGILLITRGGLDPASFLAQELKIHRIDTLCIKSYTGTAIEKELTVIKAPELENDGEGWLIVDDLADTGRTFEVARKLYPKACFVALYVKPQGKATVDFYVHEVAQDIWIKFPWEKY
jgi:xanthine phosphoribosyltransferase